LFVKPCTLEKVLKLIVQLLHLAHSDGFQELITDLAEREGFEPSIELLTLYSLSRGAPSASRASLRTDFDVAVELSAAAYRSPFVR
jgi:hypothetical protein